MRERVLRPQQGAGQVGTGMRREDLRRVVAKVQATQLQRALFGAAAEVLEMRSTMALVEQPEAGQQRQQEQDSGWKQLGWLLRPRRRRQELG